MAPEQANIDQVNHGSHSVQVGVMNGNLMVIHHHHHHAPPRKGVSRVIPRATPQHKEVLTLLKQVPDRVAVLDLMAREFGTRMVIELDQVQLYKLRTHVEAVLGLLSLDSVSEPAMDDFVRQHMLEIAAQYDAARASRQAKYGKARRNQ